MCYSFQDKHHFPFLAKFNMAAEIQKSKFFRGPSGPLSAGDPKFAQNHSISNGF